MDDAGRSWTRCARLGSVPDDPRTIIDLGSLRTEQDLLHAINRLRIIAARRRGKARLSLKDLETATGVPKSSLANYLTGRTLMPVDVLDRVVIALGVPPDQAGGWSAAWERLTEHRLPVAVRPPQSGDRAEGRPTVSADGTPARTGTVTGTPIETRDGGPTGTAGGSADPDGHRVLSPPPEHGARRPLWTRLPARGRVVVFLVLGGLVLAGGWVVLQSTAAGGDDPHGVPDGATENSPHAGNATGAVLSVLAARGGRVRIRPARTPALCITEGREHTGRYTSAVAVQRPCAEAEPPATYVRPIPGKLFQIQWRHPQMGDGCLMVKTGGPAKDMLEPLDDCDPERENQRFHIEPATSPLPGSYRLRPSHTRWCLGLLGDSRAPDAEVVQESCLGQADQEYFIDLVSAGLSYRR